MNLLLENHSTICSGGYFYFENYSVETLVDKTSFQLDYKSRQDYIDMTDAFSKFIREHTIWPITLARLFTHVTGMYKRYNFVDSRFSSQHQCIFQVYELGFG